VVYDRLVKPGIIDLNRLVELFSINPAKIFNLTERGSLKPGNMADITILNLDADFEITENYFYSKANNSPFIGWKGKGAVAYTIANGQIVYQSS
jgi:dihydroorotase